MEYLALAGWSALLFFYETLRQNDAAMRETYPALLAHAMITGLFNGALGAVAAQIHPALVGVTSTAMFSIATRTGRATVKIITQRIQERIHAEATTERVHAHAEAPAD